MAEKSVAKSIRLTPEVFTLVNTLPGEGFNQKFENMVLRYFKEEKALSLRLESLQSDYDRTRRELSEAESIIRTLEDIKRKLSAVSIAAMALPKEGQ